MSYLEIKDVKVLNIEHTNMCNLQCPQCARMVNGKINKNLQAREMFPDEYERIIPPELCKQLDHIFFCGNYGDACCSINFLKCVKYLRNNKVPLTIYTNGSMRGTTWWTHLAWMLDNKCKVVFSIDGLKDTNGIYRVNSHYYKIMQNAQAFINAGGIARWDFLVFDHNHHQIEECKKLASDMGFKIFNEKKTKRFIDNQNYKTNKGGGQFGSIVDRYGSWSNYVDQTEIECKYQTSKTLYIDHQLFLWPCCWVGAPLFFEGDNIQKNQLFKLLSQYEPGFNSLDEYSIEEILEHPWFKNDLENSWNCTMETGKLMTCGRTCGQEYKFSSGDKVNKKETRL